MVAFGFLLFVFFGVIIGFLRLQDWLGGIIDKWRGK